jgi:hypothetical protein
MKSLNENAIDFKVIEKKVFNFVCDFGVRIIKEILESMDKILAEERDKENYRHKGLKKNTIKTVMGPVEYKRAVYKHMDEEGTKRFVYLLDEYLGMGTIGKMSGLLVEKVLENVTLSSYRNSAENVRSVTGQSISHGGAWNIVQKLGEKLQDEEIEKIDRLKSGKLKGEREVETLFMESDGLWLTMQGKDRPKKGKSKKREIKIGIHYEGWERRSGKKEAYVTKNKRVVAGFTDAKTFSLIRDASIAETYNIDEIKCRILNGDGAGWIKNGFDADGDYFQLDRFHISQAIIRNIKDKKESSNLLRLFRESKFKSFMKRLEELKFECGGVYEEVKKIEELESYIRSNKEGIVPYKKRLHISPPPHGVYYRDLGVMESNVFSVLGNRMKGRKMSWSIEGANNLSKILAVKSSGRLYEKIDKFLKFGIPQKAVEVYEETINRITEQQRKVEKKIKFYQVREGKIPFRETFLTEGRKAIRKMFDQKLFTEMIYR